MKRFFVSIFIIVFCLGLPNNVKGQASSTAANIGIDANVIAPITIINTGPTKLNFGTVIRSSAEGTVVVTPDAQRSFTGGASVLSNSSFSPAPFSASGENNSSFTITLPITDVLLTRENGTETMVVNEFTHNSALALSPLGVATFSVGATLNLAIDQVSGEYHGAFSVTINYQ